MLKTFDPQKVNVIFNGKLLRMFGDSLFTLARDEADVSLKKGVKGDSTYVINANRAGKLTITLQQESPDIPYLERCAERHVKSSLTITDANESGVLFFAQDCMVEKLPDRVRGKDAADVSIVFLIPDINIR